MARIARNVSTVTQGDWGVSFESGDSIPNGGVRLSVYIFRANLRNKFGGLGRFQYGDHNGKLFASQKEANQFAFEHGYTRVYHTSPDLRAHRKEKARDPRKPWIP